MPVKGVFKLRIHEGKSEIFFMLAGIGGDDPSARYITISNSNDSQCIRNNNIALDLAESIHGCCDTAGRMYQVHRVVTTGFISCCEYNARP